MYNFQKIRELVSPKEIAMRYLGTPIRQSNGKNWYSSPFRRDTIPSFVADEKGFYDFGDNQYYDIIGLVSKMYNIHYKNAAELIVKDFNLTSVENTILPIEIKNLKKIRKEQVEIRNNMEKFCNNMEKYIIDEIKVSNLEIFYIGKNFFDYNSLKIKDKLEYIDYLTDRAFELEDYKQDLAIVLSAMNRCTKEEIYEIYKKSNIDYQTQIKKLAKILYKYSDESEISEYRNLGLQSVSSEIEIIEL